MTTPTPAFSPATLSARALFEPIAAALTRFASPQLPSVGQLDDLRDEFAPGSVNANGRPIRFVTSEHAASGYEEHVFATGEVPTRANDWHDFFNALAWCAWPQTKAACNALHVTEIRTRRAAGDRGRGPCRDALTQFDECGVVIASADGDIPALLRAHEWEEAFWQRRSTLTQTTRFMVFGHGTWDQLREPFVGLCAKAIYRTVDRNWLAMPASDQQAETDQWLARHLTENAAALAPRALAPLPLLGIPGVTPESESRDYYRDPYQFRPAR